MRSVVVVAAAWLGLGCLSSPPSPPRQSKLLLPLEAFRVAGNGLRVVIVPEPRAAHVQVTMRYLVGSSDDPVGREGLAHLVEHVMFAQRAGAKHTIGERFAKAAWWYNGVTDLETTTFYSRSAPERLGELLQLEGLRVGIGCKTLLPEALEHERAIVLHEVHQRAAQARASTAVRSALYSEGHLYRRSVGGDDASLARITRDDVCSFIAAHYSPDNAVLVVSGRVTTADVDAALGTLLGRVAKHPIAAHPHIAPVVRREPSTHTAPIAAPRIVAVWPLPEDPVARTRIRAAASLLRIGIDRAIKGHVEPLEIGGARATLLGFAIAPGPEETLDEALAGAENAALGMQMWVDPLLFESTRQRAVYGVFSLFEDGLARDGAIADHVLAGRDPAAALTIELDAWKRLSAGDAARIVREHLAFRDATIVRLEPEATGVRTLASKLLQAVATLATPGERATRPDGPVTPALEPAIHPIREPRIIDDPASAHAAAPQVTGSDPLAGRRERVLGNGLRVVLLPLSDVPTVDIRLVFPTGSAADPEDRQGLMLFAAHALLPRGEDAETFRAFYLAGGQLDVDVALEHTTFRVRGLSQHIDALLAGLDRLVDNGWYPSAEDLAKVRDEVRVAVAKQREADRFDSAWQRMLFGADHPYGLAGTLSPGAFDRAALVAHRSARLRAGSATLIVAGGFDAALADRWIDYLFGPWSGGGRVVRGSARAVVEAASFAAHRSSEQVEVRIAIPIEAAAVAHRAIAAAMVDAAVADVRTELAASYALDATLAEERLWSAIVITGFVAANRAAEAIALIRDRIGRLSAGDEAAASRFVRARRDVMARRTSGSTGASALAAIMETSIDLGRPIDAELAVVEQARTVTLGELASALRGLDLKRAAIWLHGPREAVTAAFAALGRTPQIVEPRP